MYMPMAFMYISTSWYVGRRPYALTSLRHQGYITLTYFDSKDYGILMRQSTIS
jgi:hypothetical protein